MPMLDFWAHFWTRRLQKVQRLPSFFGVLVDPFPSFLVCWSTGLLLSLWFPGFPSFLIVVVDRFPSFLVPCFAWYARRLLWFP